MLVDELELESWLNESGFRSGADRASNRRSLGSTYIRIPSNAVSRSGDHSTATGKQRPLKLRLVRVDSAKEREEART
jgi:hypothetical protein